ESSPERGIGGEAAERHTQLAGIAGRDQEARLLLRDRLDETADPAGDDGAAGGHRLERGDAEPFVERRQRHDVGSSETGSDVPTKASEADHAGTEWRRGAGERVGLAPVAAEDEAELVAATAQLGGRLEENGVPLAPLEGSEGGGHHLGRRAAPPPTAALRCPGMRHP